MHVTNLTRKTQLMQRGNAQQRCMLECLVRTQQQCFLYTRQRARDDRSRAVLCSIYSAFTHKSSYCFQCVLAIAILSICLSIRVSHRWISQKRCKIGSSPSAGRL